jgi:hypothetical protein|nr:MAG TPA: hypothetical protein [Caudoviricetes sp.]
MYYALIVVVIIGVVVYACLKKKRGNTEKSHEEEKPHDVDNHTGITVKVPIESKGCIVKDGIKKEVTIRYMPQGLQVFDENGVCVLDITSRLCKYIGKFDTSFSDGSIIDEQLNGAELWYIVLRLSYDANNWKSGYSDDIPVISSAGNILQWKYRNEDFHNKIRVQGIYGVY